MDRCLVKARPLMGFFFPPLPLLPPAAGSPTRALFSPSFNLPIQRVTQWPSFVEHRHFLCLLSLLLSVKQQRFFAPQCLRYSHRPVIDLARRLIALQLRIDSDEDSLCLWLLLAVLFFAYTGTFRL